MPSARTTAAFLAVCAFALGACGGDGQKAKAPATANGVTDVQRAALLPLRTSDLPSGFAAVDAQMVTATPMVNTCLTGLLGASALQLGESFVQNRNEISSQSYLLATASAATQTLAATTSNSVQKCLTDLLRTQFDSFLQKNGVKDLSASTSFNTLDPSTALFRAIAVRSDNTATQTVATTDLIITQPDRSVSSAWVSWFGGSPDQATEKSLVTALQARATSALSK